MLAEAKLAMDGIKGALDIAKTLKDVRDEALIATKVSDLMALMIQAQSHASAAYARETELAQRIRDLEAKVASFQKWETEKQRYELVKASGGARVYAIKESERGVEPTHYICPACYERGQKMIFQFARKYEGGPVHACPH
jgi:hypothetical protein